MEKSKLTTVTNVSVGPQVSTEGYICTFDNLKVTYCYLDDIMVSPDENLKAEELFNEHESALLGEFNETLKKDGIIKSIKFVEDHPHNSLWKIIAEKALLDLDFLNAERALLKIDDFKTLKYVKKLQQLDDREKQRAEILTLQSKYE